MQHVPERDRLWDEIHTVLVGEETRRATRTNGWPRASEEVTDEIRDLVQADFNAAVEGLLTLMLSEVLKDVGEVGDEREDSPPISGTDPHGAYT